MSKRGKRWTEEEKEFVHQNFETMTISNIAKTLERTESAINAIITNNRYKSETLEKQKKIIIDLYEKDITYEEIAKILGVSTGTVANRVVALKKDGRIKKGTRVIAPREVKTSTLCWLCKHSLDSGCNWSRNFTPVDGWEATENEQGYCIKKCPLFERR